MNETSRLPATPKRLLEELELVDRYFNDGLKWRGREPRERWAELRSQRLAATEKQRTDRLLAEFAASQPTYQEGQEVYVRAIWRDGGNLQLAQRNDHCVVVHPHPDDIIDPDRVVSEETGGIDYMAIRREPAGATRDPHDPEPPTEGNDE